MLLAPLIAASPVWGAAPTGDTATVDSLQIRVLNDRAPQVLSGANTAHALAIQVTDASGVSIKDAAVVFRLPESGPSGKFADGSTASIAYTDAAGKADAGDVTWGTEQGSLAVRITAVKGNAHTGVLYEQSLTTSAAPTRQPVTAAASQILAASAPASVVETKVVRPVVVETNAPAAIPARPGSLARDTEVAVYNHARDEDSPDANIPVRHAFGESSVGVAPSVSIVSSGVASGGGHSKAKWIALIAVAAGAGAALAFVHNGGSSSGSASGISIGAPTVSVGNK